MVTIDIESLTRDEKLALIDQLWASVYGEADDAELNPEDRAELRRRWELLQQGGPTGSPWEEAHARLVNRLRK